MFLFPRLPCISGLSVLTWNKFVPKKQIFVDCSTPSVLPSATVRQIHQIVKVHFSFLSFLVKWIKLARLIWKSFNITWKQAAKVLPLVANHNILTIQWVPGRQKTEGPRVDKLKCTPSTGFVLTSDRVLPSWPNLGPWNPKLAQSMDNSSTSHQSLPSAKGRTN